ncbi:hypothetical protein [Photobacterium phosphoreum]|nr:hypothetical protein [Photobacterium phosphoreum]
MTKKQRKYLEKKERKKTIFLVVSGVLGGAALGVWLVFISTIVVWLLNNS